MLRSEFDDGGVPGGVETVQHDVSVPRADRERVVAPAARGGLAAGRLSGRDDGRRPRGDASGGADESARENDTSTMPPQRCGRRGRVRGVPGRDAAAVVAAQLAIRLRPPWSANPARRCGR
jgi:hypothetical protein